MENRLHGNRGPFHMWLLVIFLLQPVVTGELCIPDVSLGGYTSSYGDQFVKTGSELFLNCTLKNEKNYKSSHLFWTMDEKRANISSVSTLDEKTVQLRLLSLPKGSFVVVCKEENSVNATTEVCRIQVYVGDPPPEKVNINCTSYDFKNITCLWKLPPSSDFSSTNWTFSQKFGKVFILCKYPIRNYTEGCMHLKETSSQTFCAFRKVAFLLNGTNAWGKSNTSHTFDQHGNVLLSPPMNLQVVNITNITAMINWDYPQSYTECVKHMNSKWNASIDYRIGFRKKEDDYYEWYKLTELSLLLKNLTPFTKYVVDIQCRLLTKDFVNEWGSSRRTQFETQPAAPLNPPGNFVASISTNSATMNATLYWTGVPEEQHFGRKFRYNIRTYSDETELLQNSTNSSYFELSNLPIQQYEFEIRSANEAGESDKWSYINMMEEDLNGNLDIRVGDVTVQNGKGKLWTYNVPWTISNENVKNVSLYWCLGKSYDGTIHCDESGIHVEESMPSVEGSYALNLPDPSPSSHMLGIGVTVTAKYRKVVWSSCSIFEIHDPLPIPYFRDIGQTWITVRWNSPQCEEKSVNFTGYYLYVYNSSGEGLIQSVSVNKSVLKYNITDLTPNTIYKIAISSWTRFRGRSSDLPELQTASLITPPDVTTRSILYVILPVCAGLLLTAVAGYFICKRINARVTTATTIFIELPEKLQPLLHTSNINSTPSKQNSRDDWNSREYNAQHTNNSSMQPPSTGLIGSSQDESSEDSGVDATSPLSEDYERMLQDQQSPRGPIHGYSVVATPYLQPSILQGPEPREIPQTYYVVGTGERLPIHRSPSMGIASSLVRNQVPGYTKVVSFATPELTNSRRNRDAHHFPYVPHSSDVESEMGHVLVERENRFPVPDVGEPELTFTNGPGYAQLSVAMDKSSTLQASPSQHASDEMSTSAELSLNVLGNNGCRNITRVTESAELAEASPCQHKTDCVCSKNNHKPYTATQLQPSAADAFQANSVSGYKGIKESSLQSDDSAFQTPSTNSMVGIRESLPLNLSPRMGVRSSIIRNRGPQYTKVSPLTIPKLSSHD